METETNTSSGNNPTTQQQQQPLDPITIQLTTAPVDSATTASVPSATSTTTSNIVGGGGIPHPQQQQQRPIPNNPPMEQEPSRVLHVRNVGPEIYQEDLLALCSPFGVVERIIILRQKRQALVQMQALDSSAELIRCFTMEMPPNIKGRHIHFQFSSHQELTSPSDNTAGRQPGLMLDKHPRISPIGRRNRILLVTILNDIYPITADVLHQVFSMHGVVEKVAIFTKSKGLQALIQYANEEQATSAKENLQGQNIYPGGACSLHVQYSKLSGDLKVRSNTELSRDFTTPPSFRDSPPPPRGGGGSPIGGGGQNRLVDYNPHYGGGPSHFSSPNMFNEVETTTASCVLLASSLNTQKVNCTVLFNLFSNYGNIVRIKFLHHKPDHALVQMGDHIQSSTALHYLKGLVLFGKQMDVNYSHHSSINAMPSCPSDISCGDYFNSNLNRFRKMTALGDAKYSNVFKNMCEPTAMLHLSNLAESIESEQIVAQFQPFGEVLGIKVFEYNSRNQALLQFENSRAATEALVSLHNTDLLGRNLRISFSRNTL